MISTYDNVRDWSNHIRGLCFRVKRDLHEYNIWRYQHNRRYHFVCSRKCVMNLNSLKCFLLIFLYIWCIYCQLIMLIWHITTSTLKTIVRRHWKLTSSSLRCARSITFCRRRRHPCYNYERISTIVRTKKKWIKSCWSPQFSSARTPSGWWKGVPNRIRKVGTANFERWLFFLLLFCRDIFVFHVSIVCIRVQENRHRHDHRFLHNGFHQVLRQTRSHT